MATSLFPIADAGTGSSTSWASPTYKKLSLTRGAGVQSQADATVASLGAFPLSGGSNYVGWGDPSNLVTFSNTSAGDAWVSSLIWITEPLDAVAINTAPTVNLRAQESATTANYGVAAAIYHVPSAGGAAFKISWTNGGTNLELATSEAVRSPTCVAPSRSIAAGDRIALVLIWCGIGTSASGRTATGFYAGAAGATGDTFVTFTETITEQGGAPPAVIPDVGMGLRVT